MSVTQGGTSASVASGRLLRVNPLRRFLIRPETGAVVGSIAVWILFAIVAGNSGFLSMRGTSSYLSVAAELAIQAVPVALLMIGGEFDLSVGSTVGACEMIIVILSTQLGWNVWISFAMAMLFAVLIGTLNGYMVLRTGLPSFIVTLGMQYILLGVTTGLTVVITGLTVVSGFDHAPGYSSAHAVFATTLSNRQFPIELIWALALAALATWLLLGTPFGNWIFGVGGDAQAARNVGVPVARVKILLFIGTAACSCLLAMIQAVTFTNSDVLRGQGNEFAAIVAAVIGGVLLTGGYGSPIGAMFGALAFGIVEQGIVFAGVDADWYKAFIGGILLLAVLLNSYVRKLAQEAQFSSPRDALNAGIATVYQDLAMIPLLGISRNFFLGSEPTKGWGPFRRFDRTFADRVTREELAKIGIQVRSIGQPVGTLSGGERQSVAIARAVYFGAKVLILDEPTAALGVKEAGIVLRYIAQARARGLGVIFITHNPHHAYPIGDRFTLLNRGSSLGTFAKSEISREELTSMMAGGEELEELSHELAEFARTDQIAKETLTEAAREFEEESHEVAAKEQDDNA